MSAEQKERERFNKPVVVTLLSLPELQSDLCKSLKPYIDTFSPQIENHGDIDKFFSDHPELHPRIAFLLVDQFNDNRVLIIETVKWVAEIRKKNPSVKVVECSFTPSSSVYGEFQPVIDSSDLFHLETKVDEMLAKMRSTPHFALEFIKTWTNFAFLEANRLENKSELLNETQTKMEKNILLPKLLELLGINSNVFFSRASVLNETDRRIYLHLSWMIIFQISHSGLDSVDQLKLSRLKELFAKAKETYKAD